MDNLPQLATVADRYGVLLCDIWGVVHNGREAHPAACEALVRYRQGGGVVVLITNSPRPSADVVQQLATLKVPEAAWDAVVTSGDATRFALKTHAAGPVYHLGPERDAPLHTGLGLHFTSDLAAASLISCTGLFDDEHETPDAYREMLAQAKTHNLPMVCANPDVVVHRGDQLIYCAGALAELYAEMGGKVILAGKPHPPIYDLARQAAQQHGATESAQILALGDGLMTDIKGANDQGLDVVLVTGGLARDLSADELTAKMQTADLHATYVMPALR